MKRLVVSALLCATAVSAVAEGSPEKMKWWTESRFGMFIHFGLYSTPARGEWVQSKSKPSIQKEEYRTYFDQFDPDLYDPVEWAKAAKAAGMKYVVLTAKHHEGFCLWDTKFTDYKVTNTPYGKDLLKPFVDAFRAEGLRVGFYYSLLDWHHPDFAIDAAHPLHPKDDADWNDPKAYIPLNANRDMAKYRQYMKDQVRELLTDFGRIDIMWFDFSYPNSVVPKGRNEWDSEGLLKMARSIQPWLIVDDRLDLKDKPWGWDFRTPEQFRMPVWPTMDGKRVPWETCQTFSGAWGYNRDQMTWKSSAQLLELLASTVSKGGNLILNVGPTARGEFDARAKERLAAMGRWMRTNGRAIYGCTAAPEGLAAPEYSVLTYNPNTNRLYVHLVFYPMGALACPFGEKIKWARFLHDGSEVQIRPLNKNLTAAYPEVPKHNFILPVVKPDVEMPVIEVQLKDDDAPFDMPPIPMPQFADRDFSITDFGAKEGIKATGAFAAAMAECEKSGGGRVVVPKGKWLTGAVHFRSNCNLHLDEGATLEFTDDPADYLPVVHTTWEGVECMNLSPLLYAYGVTNVAITGKGLIAPRMNFWRTWFTRPPEHMYATECLYYWCSTNAPMFARDVTAIKGSNVRPHLIQFNRCKGVLLDGFRIRESPFWMIHLYHSENCIVRNLDTYAHGHNNDGVDIEMTRNVLVENCRFDQGDDGIVLKAGRNQDAWRLNRPTENIVVRNCEFVFGHTLLGIGSELSGGIRNVWMHHCKIGSAFNLFYVKTNRRRGGFVKNIWFEDVESDNLKGALFRVETDVLYQWAKFPDYELRRTEIDGLHVRNVKANCADYAIDIRGDAAAPVRNVKLEDVWLGAFRKSFERIENAEGIQKCNVRLGDLDPKSWVQPIVEVWHGK